MATAPAAAVVAAPDEARRRRARARERLVTNAWRVALLAVVAGAWEGSTRSGLVNPFWVSSPSLILADLYRVFVSGSILPHVAVSLYEAFAGFITGAVAGVLAGFALARWDRLARVLDPYVTALNSLPRVALAPLFILWFGIGLTSKIVLAFSLVVFILLVNTYAGAKNVDQDLVIITRLLGASRRQLTLKVILPASIPWIFAGFRLGVAYALIGAVVGEVIVAQAGLGFLISAAAGVFNTTGVFTALIILMVIAMLLNELMKAAERKLLRWRPQIPGV
jgi:NitT/TauT family transport system permease protein